MLSPCGLECNTCRIHLAPGDPAIAKELTQWFRDNGHPDAVPEWFHCGGCPGDRIDHWSPDCRILECCVDTHRLRSCSECTSLPCELLQVRAGQAPKYQAALDRLLQAKAEGTSLPGSQ
jgi:hypothetical protein